MLVLMMLSGIATQAGEQERAAKLVGIVDTLAQTTPLPAGVLNRIPPRTYGQSREALREQMGEVVFEKARQEGAAMSLEQAVGFAAKET